MRLLRKSGKETGVLGQGILTAEAYAALAHEAQKGQDGNRG